MVPLIDRHTPRQIHCAATDLADCSPHVPLSTRGLVHHRSLRVRGTRTTPMDWLTDDRETAHEATIDGLAALEALQSTEVWLQLPLDVQRHLSRAHGVLSALATAMVDEEVV